MITGDLQAYISAFAGIVAGIAMLIWLLSGHEIFKSQGTQGYRSKQLTRLASTMAALMLVGLGVSIFPNSPLEQLASASAVGAGIIGLASLLMSFVPQVRS